MFSTENNKNIFLAPILHTLISYKYSIIINIVYNITVVFTVVLINAASVNVTDLHKYEKNLTELKLFKSSIR